MLAGVVVEVVAGEVVEVVAGEVVEVVAGAVAEVVAKAVLYLMYSTIVSVNWSKFSAFLSFLSLLHQQKIWFTSDVAGASDTILANTLP